MITKLYALVMRNHVYSLIHQPQKNNIHSKKLSNTFVSTLIFIHWYKNNRWEKYSTVIGGSLHWLSLLSTNSKTSLRWQLHQVPREMDAGSKDLGFHSYYRSFVEVSNKLPFSFGVCLLGRMQGQKCQDAIGVSCIKWTEFSWGVMKMYKSKSLYQMRMVDCHLELDYNYGQNPETLYIYFFKSETLLSFVRVEIRTHNLLIFGQTPKPSCLGAQQEDSCLPKLLI